MKHDIQLSINVPSACYSLVISKVYLTPAALVVITELAYKSDLPNRKDLSGIVPSAVNLTVDVPAPLPVKHYLMAWNPIHVSYFEGIQLPSVAKSLYIISEETPSPVPSNAVCLHDIDTTPTHSLFNIQGHSGTNFTTRTMMSYAEQEKDSLAYSCRWPQ